MHLARKKGEAEKIQRWPFFAKFRPIFLMETAKKKYFSKLLLSHLKGLD